MESQRSNNFDQCYALYRLQLHQLDRERNRIILWNDQSGFDYDGRPNHRGSDFHAQLTPYVKGCTDRDVANRSEYH